MNSALLAKLAWRVLTAPDSLLCKIINTKYSRKGYIGRSGSKISQGLKAGFKNLEGKIMWKIGSVQKVKLGVVGAQVKPRYQHLLHLLSLLLQIKRNSWNANKIKEVFHPPHAKEILNLPSPSTTREDALIWLPSHTSLFC